jgi:hypothetical protein
MRRFIHELSLGIGLAVTVIIGAGAVWITTV